MPPEKSQHELELKNCIKEFRDKGWRVIDMKRKSPDAIALKNNKLIIIEIVGATKTNNTKWHTSKTKKHYNEVWCDFDAVVLKHFYYSKETNITEEEILNTRENRRLKNKIKSIDGELFVFVPKIFNMENAINITAKIKNEAEEKGENCSIKRTKQIVSETIDNVDLGVINKFVKSLLLMDCIKRVGNRYEVVDQVE